MFKRVLVLGGLAIVLALVGLVYIAFRGGLHEALGLGVTFHWVVQPAGEVDRTVTIAGIAPVARSVAGTLKLDEAHGWAELRDGSSEGLVFHVRSPPDAPGCSLTEVVEHGSSQGLLRRTHVLHERFDGAVLDAGDVLAAASRGEGELELDGELGSLWDELGAALGESRDRAERTGHAFLAGIPVEVRVDMPGRVIETGGLAKLREGVTGYTGTLGELVGGELVVRSAQVTTTAYVTLYAAGAVCLMVAATIARVRIGRQT